MGCTIDAPPAQRACLRAEHQLHWIVLHRSSGIVELKAPHGWLADSVS
jgi:hypothetical protein